MKRNYCQFCGARVKKLSIIQGVYREHSCSNEDCPKFGRDYAEDGYDSFEDLKGLTIYKPGDDQ